MPDHRHNVVDVDGLEARGRIGLSVEDDTSAELGPQLADGTPVDLPAADAVRLAGALSQHAGELVA